MAYDDYNLPSSSEELFEQSLKKETGEKERERRREKSKLKSIK